jgi:hypothetical protein
MLPAETWVYFSRRFEVVHIPRQLVTKCVCVCVQLLSLGDYRVVITLSKQHSASHNRDGGGGKGG